MPQTKTTKKASTKVTPAKKVSSKRVTAKKSSTKTAAKSATTKKSSAKKLEPTKARALVCSSDDTCFWTTDGRVLEHLADLEVAFGSMDESVFLYHANKEKNDFSDWVEHVLEDAALAASLRRCRKPKSAQQAVKKHLKTEYNFPA